MLSLQTGCPPCVCRSSGSRPRCPRMIALFTPAMAPTLEIPPTRERSPALAGPHVREVNLRAALEARRPAAASTGRQGFQHRRSILTRTSSAIGKNRRTEHAARRRCGARGQRIRVAPILDRRRLGRARAVDLREAGRVLPAVGPSRSCPPSRCPTPSRPRARSASHTPSPQTAGGSGSGSPVLELSSRRRSSCSSRRSTCPARRHRSSSSRCSSRLPGSAPVLVSSSRAALVDPSPLLLELASASTSPVELPPELEPEPLLEPPVELSSTWTPVALGRMGRPSSASPAAQAGTMESSRHDRNDVRRGTGALFSAPMRGMFRCAGRSRGCTVATSSTAYTRVVKCTVTPSPGCA
jgi:hypothetical protein